MKRISVIFSIIILGSLPLLSQNVSIPDTAFLHALIYEGVDTNNDSLISYEEAELITDLLISGWQKISDLTGIEAFVNLERLSCSNNQLTSLDVTKNTKLENLDCQYNYLTSLDVLGCSKLIYLDCEDNQLSSLDVSYNPALKNLDCSYNRLNNLDVSNNTSLTQLYCYNNQLNSLNVTGTRGLIELSCGSNQLSSLDISGCDALKVLRISANQLTNLDVSQNIFINELWCGQNKITNLNVTGCSELTYLDCHKNQISSLNLSSNTSIFQGYWWTGVNLSGMLSLKQVCVWELPFPPVGREGTVDTTNSPNVYFTTDCTIGINQPDIAKEIQIYPNPTEGIITIDLCNSQNADIEIYNTNGMMIYSKPLHSAQQQIDLSGYPKGLYFVKVRQQGMLKVGKVVVR